MAEKKLNDHITSYTKLKFKLISTKGFTKDLINGCSIFNGANYFVEDGPQNYLVIQPVFKYFQTFTGTDKILAWKSKGLSEGIFKTPVVSGNSFAPKLTSIYNERIGAKFKGSCFIQDNISFTHRIVVNLFNVYKLV